MKTALPYPKRLPQAKLGRYPEKWPDYVTDGLGPFWIPEDERHDFLPGYSNAQRVCSATLRIPGVLQYRNYDGVRTRRRIMIRSLSIRFLRSDSTYLHETRADCGEAKNGRIFYIDHMISFYSIDERKHIEGEDLQEYLTTHPSINWGFQRPYPYDPLKLG